ncbi:alpha/beta hydrolase [Acinetobacter ursingii]|uniref:Alpha/beta hydrolase n=1 Tax=Acinetobacter ursingii TaxID=108980 RepID=A0AA46NRC2_9GAMM|nr:MULTISPECIES: alpha/beta hydrolase [Acinetobacter]MCU4490766.1 alpha/beta hydrolase [Acinetobacter ursingii]MCU4495978.1 alpha/beta hydrolase [Acinetobacter ursingii]MCU4602084.1 alpha/beta hydrolase [Acinetobacter ursingii]MDA3577752.1 alpha/beta hydrolase [Acinetobacter ursingii]MDH0191928.1 alpha/beta hydrolase [Acinetobacter ursingii]
MKINTMWKQYITEAFLKTVIRTPSQFSLPPSTTRTALDQLCRIFPVNKEVHIRPIRLAGIKAEEIKPQSSSTQLIFHIHGGAFFLGSLNTHRAFMTDIAARTQMQVIHVDYPLAPESGFPDALDALYDIYQLLLDQGIQAKDIILSGDSCGANLALALCLRLKENQDEQPSGLILMSPFLDLTLSSESLRFNRKHDALLSIEALEAGIDYYLGNRIATDNPQVSPLFDDLSGLPPTLVQVGSKEILLDDAKRFRDQAKQAGVDVEFKLYTGMWHNFQMFSAWFDQAKHALTDISEFAHQLDKD